MLLSMGFPRGRWNDVIAPTLTPASRYRLRLQFQERLRQLGQTLSGRRRGQPASEPPPGAPTYLMPSASSGLAGRNCFFSPIQCQLPIIEINRQANAAASAVPHNFSPAQARMEADFRLKRRRLTEGLERGKIFAW